MENCKYYTMDCKQEEMGCKGCAYCKKGMTINTKYSIGQKVWIVIKNTQHKEVEIFSDVIDGVIISENNTIKYYLSDICDDVLEENIIDYEDTEELMKKIKEYDLEVCTSGERTE